MSAVLIVCWALFAGWFVLLGSFELRTLRRHRRGLAAGRAGGFKYIPLSLAIQAAVGTGATATRAAWLVGVFAAEVLVPFPIIYTAVRNARRRIRDSSRS